MPRCLSTAARNRDLARAGLAPICQQADWSGVLLGHEAREREDVDQLPAPGLDTTSEVGIEQRLGPRAIGVGVRTDHHDRNSLRPVDARAQGSGIAARRRPVGHEAAKPTSMARDELVEGVEEL